jgi:two-component sensor histidine kinase/putative methionine-R-sulfoxide reductase with GAF domain
MAMSTEGASCTEKTLARLREYQRTLEAFSRIGAEAMPPEKLMHHVAAQVSRVTHIERTKILRYRPDKGDLLIEAGVGWNEGVVGHVAEAVDHRSPAGRAFQTGAPVIIDDLAKHQEFRRPDVLKEHGIISLLNVPVMINGYTWGVLEIDSVRPAAYEEWEVGFLSTLANMMGTCLAYHEAKQEVIEGAAKSARERAQFEMTLRELQHRVKNNLQIIVAFLSLKMREGSPEVREPFDAVIGRVQAIALAHDLLSAGQETSSVDFADYLHSLCANIDPRRPDLSIEVEAERANVPIDRAVPAGLVVNELVTNSIKYAFGNGGGNIRVTFHVINNSSEGCVAVEDNGKGMSGPPKKGLGLTLVEGFAQQLQGRLQFPEVETGSRVILCFPVAL